ncbi:Double-stranded RNA-binding protein 1 [Citrus sinensis]|nr:Double-stranded RNA-binding protein 1 [Citrus sinensis]
MYKTKVQELCHQKRWSLPRYSTMKDGADHDPRFKSSVSVNGLSFHSSVSCKSSKESQNDAAKLAFLHFTSPPPPPSELHYCFFTKALRPSTKDEPLADQGLEMDEKPQLVDINHPDISDSLISIAEPSAGEVKIAETCQDVQCRYKSVLQNYARRKNLDSPLYSSIREGPAHACSFKARVTIDGHTFESLEFFKNLKQAEHAAAKDDGVFYKNVLHELSLREGLPVPLYETIKCGAPHMPTFISMVEVDGEVFYGKAGRTKKKAEMKAAKVAYTALIERGRSCSIGSITHTVKADGVPNSTLSSDLDVTLDPNFIQKSMSVSSPVLEHGEDGKELDVSALSISDSMAAKRATVTSSYLLCNRVRVYTRIPDIAFPKGITLMPISEDKWVAVSLEFPNEEGN